MWTVCCSKYHRKFLWPLLALESWFYALELLMESVFRQYLRIGCRETDSPWRAVTKRPNGRRRAGCWHSSVYSFNIFDRPFEHCSESNMRQLELGGICSIQCFWCPYDRSTVSNSDKTYFTYACVNEHNASIGNGPSSAKLDAHWRCVINPEYTPIGALRAWRKPNGWAFNTTFRTTERCAFQVVYMAWQNHFSAHTIARKCNGFECSAPRSKMESVTFSSVS